MRLVQSHQHLPVPEEEIRCPALPSMAAAWMWTFGGAASQKRVSGFFLKLLLQGVAGGNSILKETRSWTPLVFNLVQNFIAQAGAGAGARHGTHVRGGLIFKWLSGSFRHHDLFDCCCGAAVSLPRSGSAALEAIGHRLMARLLLPY